MPTFTIVTPSYQHGSFIRQTIDSVLNQSFKDIEYWIIDGGSTDKTKSILTSYGKKIRWLSENDRGQADAINKGLLKAKGDIVAWLNSDDFYEPGTLQKVSDYFGANPQIDFIFGDMNFVDRDGNNPQKCDYLSDFSLPRLLKYCYICQPSVFFRRSVIDRVGLLNTKYTYAFDYDYWLRVGKLIPGRIKRVSLGTLSNLRTYKSRKTEAGIIPMRQEVIKMMFSHGYWYAPAIIESVYLIVKSKLSK